MNITGINILTIQLWGSLERQMKDKFTQIQTAITNLHVFGLIFTMLLLIGKIKAHVGINGRLFPPAEIRLLNFQLRDGLRCFHPPSLACLCHDLFVVTISVHKSTHTWPTLQKKKKKWMHSYRRHKVTECICAQSVWVYCTSTHTHSYCCPLSGRVT